MADSLKNLGKKIGFRISAHKTKIQKTQNLENYADIFLERAPPKVVENFTYLGSIQSNVVGIEKMLKVELEKPVHFSDGFKLFRDPKKLV